MFDLEHAILEWRKQMLSAGIRAPVPLDELESHLRDDVDRHVKSGMNSQEAFYLAVQQMGQAGNLRKEFGKVGEVMSAGQRKFNIIVCDASAVLLGLIGVGLLFLFFGKSPSLSFYSRLTVSGAFVSAALILWSWRFCYRFFPALSKRTRIIVAFLCIVLSGFGAAVALNFVLSVSGIDRLLAAAWIMLPFALAASIVYSLEEVAYQKMAMSVGSDKKGRHV